MAMNSDQLRELADKLDRLPPEQVAEVEDFVDFLVSKARDRAFDAFLSTAEKVAESGVPVMSTGAIEAEVKAYRDQHRRAAGS
jgi:hypothetical protein